MSLLHDIRDFFLPRCCHMCGQRLASTERSLCAGCLRSLPRVNYVGGEHHGYIEKLFWGQIPVEKATSMFYFTGTEVRQLIHSLKYANQPSIGRDLGAVAAQEKLATGFFEGVDCIVPMPLHRKRIRERGYNQSMAIAQGMSQVTGIPINDRLVARIKDNPSQTHLNIEERRENVQGVFQLIPGAEENQGLHILLVDDVLTTGSTLISCGSELARIPQCRISVFTLGFATEMLDMSDENTFMSLPQFNI